MDEDKKKERVKPYLRKLKNRTILFLLIFIIGLAVGYYFGYDIGFEKAAKILVN